MLRSLVGSEMCIRDSENVDTVVPATPRPSVTYSDDTPLVGTEVSAIFSSDAGVSNIVWQVKENGAFARAPAWMDFMSFTGKTLMIPNNTRYHNAQLRVKWTRNGVIEYASRVIRPRGPLVAGTQYVLDTGDFSHSNKQRGRNFEWSNVDPSVTDSWRAGKILTATGLPANLLGVFRQVLRDWAIFAGITFTEVTDSPAVQLRVCIRDMEMTHGPHTLGTCIHWFGVSRALLIFDDRFETSPANFYQTASHEVGHHLDLSHCPDRNQLMYAYARSDNLPYFPFYGDVAGARAVWAGATPPTQPPPTVAPPPPPPQTKHTQHLSLIHI